MLQRNLRLTLKKDIAELLIAFPEQWRRSKKEYVRLIIAKDGVPISSWPVWLGRKYDFSLNGNKANVAYEERDIEILEKAPDTSTIRVRSKLGVLNFKKVNGKWLHIIE